MPKKKRRSALGDDSFGSDGGQGGGALGKKLLLDAGLALAKRNLLRLPLLGGELGGLLALAEAEVSLLRVGAFHVGVGADGGVDLGVKLLEVILSFNSGLDEPAELPGIGFLIIVLEGVHVLANMAAEDVLAVNLSIILEVFPIPVGSREATGVVGDIQAAIGGSLQAAEHLGAGGGGEGQRRGGP